MLTAAITSPPPDFNDHTGLHSLRTRTHRGVKTPIIMVRIIQIAVDLTEAHRSLYHITVEFPVQPGSLATFTTPL